MRSTRIYINVDAAALARTALVALWLFSHISFAPCDYRERCTAICATSDSAYNNPMAKKITLKEIGDMLAHVVKHMATKDDIAELKHELKGDVARVQDQVNSIEAQLRETKIEVRLGKLEEKVFGAPRR